MKIVRNSIIPFGKKYAAINLFGVFFVKKGVVINKRLIRHESIHTRQMKEMLFIPFYIAYLIEWTILLFRFRLDVYQAYLNISHEREAYAHDADEHYLMHRPLFAQYRRRKKRF